MLVVCVKEYGHHRDIHVRTHSFPTRRSSDLASNRWWCAWATATSRTMPVPGCPRRGSTWRACAWRSCRTTTPGCAIPGRSPCRSEEHTSELQSLMRISYAVFCLKKKNNNKHLHHNIIPHKYILILNTS